MYILYLDASGVPERHPSQTSHYVLLGMAVHVGTWFAFSRQIYGLKRRYALGIADEFELHAAWLLRRLPEQDEIPGFVDLGFEARREAVFRLRSTASPEGAAEITAKRREDHRRLLRSTEPYLHLTEIERRRLVDEALAVVGGYRTDRHRHGLVLFAEAIDKSRLAVSIDPVEQAFTQVVSRFERFLRDQGRQGPGVWGVVVMDHDPHRAGMLSRLLQRFQHQGTRWGDVTQVVEAPFFLDSKLNPGVQVVDLCAYAVRRYLENGEEERIRKILGKFYRTSTGLHGLRHFTAPGCPCLICRERGHGEATAPPAPPSAQ